MTPVKYHLDLYNITYYFFIGWDQREYRKYTREHFGLDEEYDPELAGLTEFVSTTDPNSILIWVEKSNDMLVDLVHESVHGACFALDHVGVHADFSEDETLARLSELIFVKAAPKYIIETH